jgi:hypothetical protein
MKAEVSRRLAEATGRTFWSDEDIATAINLGYAELSDASEWFEQYLEIDLLEDRPYYDLRFLIGDTFLALKPGFDEQTNRWLIPSTVRQFDAHDRRWERVTGEPQRIFLRGLWWMGFFPRIQTEVGTIKAYYTALPPPLSDDTDEPGFPDTFHYGCVDFALTDLFAQDAETAWAIQAWGNYLATEGALTQWVEDRAADPMARGFDSPQTSVQR